MENYQKPPNKRETVVIGAGLGFVDRAIGETYKHPPFGISLYNHLNPEYSWVRSVYTNFSNQKLLAHQLQGKSAIVYGHWIYGGNSVPSTPVMRSQDISAIDSGEQGSNLKMLAASIRAAESARVSRFVLISAIGVCSHSKDPHLNDRYAAEALLINSSLKEKIILRIPLLYDEQGLSGGFSKGIMRLMTLPLLYPVTNENTPISLLHSEDATKVVRRLLDASALDPCGILEVVSTYKITMGELISAIGKKYGNSSKIAISGAAGKTLFKKINRKNSDFMDHFAQVCEGANRVDRALCVNNPLDRFLPTPYRPIKNLRLPTQMTEALTSV